MFNWLYTALGTLLHWFSYITGGSYALGLLLYALIFKVLLLPFSIKQQKTQIAMAKLAPKIELIKAKYKGRTDNATLQKQQQEIMELQQREGYSPLSGCLPMLIQLPIILLLYKVIRNPLSYICRISEEGVIKLNSLVNGLTEDVAFNGIDQIKLISQMTATDRYDEFFASLGPVRDIPNFNFFGQNLAETPSITAISLLCLIPIVAAGLQWLSMFLMRKWNANPNQMAAQDAQTNMSMKMMDFVMPLMTLFITFSFSAMMGLYWIYQSIISIIQTFIISRAMPIPKFTEEEIKEMRKAQKAAEKAQRAILKEQPKYRSLHYIDEDDYEELPTVKTQKPQSKNSSDRPEIKD